MCPWVSSVLLLNNNVIKSSLGRWLSSAKTVLAFHAGRAGRRRQRPGSTRTRRRAPQAHRGHVLGRPLRPRERGQLLYLFYRKDHVINTNTHHFRRHPMQRRHELCQNLKIRHHKTSISLQVDGRRHSTFLAQAVHSERW